MWEVIDGWDVRRIKKFKSLWDVSIVTYPAFYQTHTELFGQGVLTPKEVYAEYCSRSTVNNELLLHEKQESLRREHNSRNNTINLLEKL